GDRGGRLPSAGSHAVPRLDASLPSAARRSASPRIPWSPPCPPPPGRLSPAWRRQRLSRLRAGRRRSAPLPRVARLRAAGWGPAPAFAAPSPAAAQSAEWAVAEAAAAWVSEAVASAWEVAVQEVWERRAAVGAAPGRPPAPVWRSPRAPAAAPPRVHP